MEKASFCVRNISCDYYLSDRVNGFGPEPSSLRPGNLLVNKKYPIVRIFGCTPAGQKCCLHVHGVLPYFLVPSPYVQPTDTWLEQLATSIDYALNLARAKKNDAETVSNTPHVYDINIVPLKRFYGYYCQDEPFLKISFLNPFLMKRAAEFVQSGSIMNQVMQPYDLHVPYILQFFIDYNIYGMELVYCSCVKFRRKAETDRNNSSRTPPLTSSSSSLSQKIWDVQALGDECIVPTVCVSSCELEADCNATDLLNKAAANNVSSALQNPGLRFIWRDELLRRRQNNQSSQDLLPKPDDRDDGWQMTESELYFMDILRSTCDRLEDTLRPPAAESDTGNISDAHSPLVDEQSILELSQRLDDGILDTLAQLQDADVVNDANENDTSSTFDVRHFSANESDIEEETDEEQHIQMSQTVSTWMDELDDLDVAVQVDQLDGPVGSLDRGKRRRQPSRACRSAPSPPRRRKFSKLMPDGRRYKVSVPVDADLGKIGSEIVAIERLSQSQLGLCNCSVNEEQLEEDPLLLRLDDVSNSSSDTMDTGQIDGLENEEQNSLRLRLDSESTVSSQSPPRLKTDHHATANEDSNMDEPISPQIHAESSETRPIEWDPGSPGPSGQQQEILLSDSFDSVEVNERNWIELETVPPDPFEVDYWLRHGEHEMEDDRSSDSDSSPSISDDGDVPVVGLAKRKRPCKRKLQFDASKRKPAAPPQLNETGEQLELFLEPDGTSPDCTADREEPMQIDAVVPSSLENRTKTKDVNYMSLLGVKQGRKRVSQIECATPENSFGFNITLSDMHDAGALNEIRHVTVLCMELLIRTRDSFCPDPTVDPVLALSYSIFVSGHEDRKSGTFAIESNANLGYGRLANLQIMRSEEELIQQFVEFVKSCDPDILLGYDIQRLSWGYFLERAKTKGMDLCAKISRIPDDQNDSRYTTDDHWWSLGEFKISGRIVLNLWRIMRHELSLTSYSFENVLFHVLKQRAPAYSYQTLTSWYDGDTRRHRLRALHHLRFRAEGCLNVMLHCDLLNRTSEMARLYGIQFYDVLSRGSQFRVESMMLRMTREQGFAAVSPSVNQRNRMAAPECIPLTLEPESGFYSSPVLVLDFQSLYPSMVIAYNYCYSTCLGKVQHWNDLPHIEMGCVGYDLNFKTAIELKEKVHISPAGVVFVRESVRRGILPQMLEEILNTRIMVKDCMKQYKSNRALYQILDARQLGLKLIANVTYGYTAANFSGRMPCVEVADSIVHKGRETLERAIKLVNESPKWNARVVYGDTDSLFVHLPGRTKSEAFKIGADIAAAVTADNPKPVKLKFEKVFYPCVLQTKKRYVGYSYESFDQQKPVFDAKGIETVRRDTCPAVSKTLSKALRILFDCNGQIEPVHHYVTRQFSRIERNRVAMKEFVFAKEYRGRMGYKPTACVPALQIAKRRTATDKRAEPRTKERVPYVIVAGSPRATLISCVREPWELIKDDTLRVNTSYYINGQLVPALNRVFALMGEDVGLWLRQMPHCFRPLLGSDVQTRVAAQRTLSHFFDATECLCCAQLTTRDICVECRNEPRDSLVTLYDKISMMERRLLASHKICISCTGVSSAGDIACECFDCPLYFRRSQFNRDIAFTRRLCDLIDSNFDF